MLKNNNHKNQTLNSYFSWIVVVLIFFLSGCTFNVKKNMLASQADAPTDLVLIYPTSSPGNVANPKIQVNGVHAGDQVSLYSDATCSTVLSTGAATSSLVELQVTTSLAPGIYTIYSDYINSKGKKSKCSSVSLSYTYLDSSPITSNITIDDVTISESAGSAVVTVHINPVNNQNVNVQWTTSNATALAGTDYTAASNSLTFLPGETTKTLSISILNDTKDENDKTFEIKLSNASSNAIISDDTSTVTITDDDSPPTLSIANTSVTEGGNLVFTVTASVASEKTISFTWSTSDGTATTADSDYIAHTNVPASITPGNTTTTLTLPTGADTNQEANETLTVTLSNLVNATAGTVSATGTIIDDDNPAFTWTGLAGNNLWSDSNNWSNGTVPGSSDIAKFNSSCTGTNCNVSINQNVDVAGILMNSTYTGTITQGLFTVTVGTSGWNQSSGTWTGNMGATSFTLKGDFSLSGGTFNAGSTFIISSTSAVAVNITGGSFVKGTVFRLDGSGAVTINVNSTNLGNLEIKQDTATSDVTITGTAKTDSLTIDDNPTGVELNGGTLEVIGTLQGLTGSFSGGTATILVNGTGNQTFQSSSGINFPTISINKSSGNLNLVGTINLDRGLTYTAGTISYGTSVIKMVGSTSATISGSGFDFYDFEFVKSGSATITMAGTHNVRHNYTMSVNGNGVTFDGGGTFNLYGNALAQDISSGTLNSSSDYILNFVGTSPQTITSTDSEAFSKIIFASSSTITFGTTVYISRDITYSSGTIVTSSSTTFFVGSGQSSTVNTSTMNFDNVYIQKANGTHLNVTGNMNISGMLIFNITDAGGSQTRNGNINISGDIVNADANNTGGTTTLTLNGTGNQTISQVSGSKFPGASMTVNKASGKVLQLTNVALNYSGQDLIMTAGNWDMAGFNLTIVDNLSTAAGTKVMKGCGTLSYSTHSPSNGVIGNGTYGSTISIANAADANEGTNLVFTVSISPQNCTATTFDYATSDGTAVAGSDYTATSGSTNIPANTSSITISVPTTVDYLNESTENLSMTLSNILTGTTTGTLTATGNILSTDLPTFTVSPAYATNGSNWNDYVKNNGSSIFNATDVACAGTEQGYSACIHGGALKKVVITGISSCSGLSMTDNLGVFSWMCLAASGTATFFSIDFKPGKGLRDLLNSNSWKNNYVILTGTSTGSSASTTWWTNTVSPLTSGGGGTLSSSSIIYTVPAAQTTTGYLLTGNKSAIVTLGSYVLTFSGSSGGITIESKGNFNWIEAKANGAAVAGSSLVVSGATGGGNFNRTHNSFFTNEILAGWEQSIFVNWGAISNKISYTTLQNGNADGIWFGMNGTTNYHTLDNVIVTGYRNPLIFQDSTNDEVYNTTIYGNSYGVYFNTNTSGITVRNLNIYANGTAGLSVNGNGSNKIFDTTLSDNTGDGLYVSSSNNIFNNIKSYNNISSNGVRLTSSASNNIFTNLISTSSSVGIFLSGSSANNIFNNVTIANQSSNGIQIDTSNNNTLNQIITANTPSGVKFSGSASSSNTFSQFVSTNNSYGADLSNLSNNSKFTGYILFGNNATSNCNVTGGTNPGLVTSTCANNGASDSVLRTGITLSSSFVGKISSNDTSNTSDSSGQASFPGTPAAFDWINFSTFFRTWGINGSAFPNSDHRGTWTTGTGRIWDWQILSTDTSILAKSVDGSSSNGSFTSGSACPSAVHGNKATIDQNSSSVHTYLLNAAEIIDPLATGYSATGNHNGLCESNESCIYSPNFGVYQGHGTLGTCTFTNGTVTGVTMYGYSLNGQ